MQRYIVDNPGGGMTVQGRSVVDPLVETIKQRTFNTKRKKQRCALVPLSGYIKKLIVFFFFKLVYNKK